MRRLDRQLEQVWHIVSRWLSAGVIALLPLGCAIYCNVVDVLYAHEARADLHFLRHSHIPDHSHNSSAPLQRLEELVNIITQLWLPTASIFVPLAVVVRASPLPLPLLRPLPCPPPLPPPRHRRAPHSRLSV